MHETHAVVRAISDHMTSHAGPVPARIRVVILDPLRAEADAVQLIAEACLRERGVTEPVVEVEVVATRCPMCGASGTPSPHDPACHACGMPLRPLAGPALVIDPNALRHVAEDRVPFGTVDS